MNGNGKEEGVTTLHRNPLSSLVGHVGLEPTTNGLRVLFRAFPMDPNDSLTACNNFT